MSVRVSFVLKLVRRFLEIICRSPYAALRCLPRPSWKAIQRTAARRSRRFGCQRVRAARQHGEGQKKMELHGLWQLDVPKHGGGRPTERMGYWPTTGRLAEK